jgi:hypothetical protein
MNKTSQTYRNVFEALEHSWVYDHNQMFLEAGKKRPVTGFLRGLEYQTLLDIGAGPENTWNWREGRTSVSTR